MTWIVFAELVAKVGIPAAQQIYLWTQAGKVVTAEDWLKLDALSAYRSSDSLAAAGLQIINGEVVPK